MLARIMSSAIAINARLESLLVVISHLVNQIIERQEMVDWQVKRKSVARKPGDHLLPKALIQRPGGWFVYLTP
jgi:hypothetical protein